MTGKDDLMPSSFDKVSNNIIYKFGLKITDYMTLSLLWLLLSLPVVTSQTASAAVYYASYKKFYKHSDDVTANFFKAFKGNIRNGLIISLIYIIYSAIATANILFGYYGYGNIKLPDFYFPLSFIGLIPIVFTLPFVFPYLARFDDPVKTTLKHGFIFCMMNFSETMKLWLIKTGFIVLTLVFPPAVLLTPAVYIRIVLHYTEPCFRNAMKTIAARDKEVPEEVDGDE